LTAARSRSSTTRSALARSQPSSPDTTTDRFGRPATEPTPLVEAGVELLFHRRAGRLVAGHVLGATLEVADHVVGELVVAVE